ncbi:MAG: 4-hydroxy-tetrahydrodipicolinate reductase [Gemmatimonadota bacterium]|nr:4-hydroxy-tetrahydrodipicolinate reductase [Gemmatimonadota bacterium]
MSGPRIAVIGDGKMGRAVAQLAGDAGLVVTAVIGRADNTKGARVTRAAIGDADVAIEFTEPAAAVDNVRACLRAGCPVVVGTTGWYHELDDIVPLVKESGAALLYAPNFSIGANILWQAAEYMATLAARAGGFDAHIIEVHHNQKKDAPSGTAAELGKRASAALGRAVPITSVRVGSVPGTHQLILDGTFEQLTIEHVARDRRVFAEGAIAAARWLVGKRGVFTMRDVLSPGTAP